MNNTHHVMQDFYESINNAISHSETLIEILGRELDSLKNNDLAEFEDLQQEKQEVIISLKTFDSAHKAFCQHLHIDPFADDLQRHMDDRAIGNWQQLLAQLKQCEQIHRTSDLYIRNKLEHIQTALIMLEVNSPTEATNLYNQMGRQTASSSGRSLTIA